MDRPKPRNFTLGISAVDHDRNFAFGLGILQHPRAVGQLEHAFLEPAFVAGAGGLGRLCKALFASLEAKSQGHQFRSRQVTADRIKEGQAVFRGGWSAGSATGQPGGKMESPPQPSRMIRIGRFKRLTFTTEPVSSRTTDEDLCHMIFMTGPDGTPMPSWSDNIKPDEAGNWRSTCVSRSP